MKTSVTIIIIFVCGFSTGLAGRLRKCKTIKGLPCGSKTSLDIGDKLTVSSRVCRTGRYPNKERCQWKFQVGPRCLPRIQCHRLDIAGNWRLGCRGDSLRVETENVRFNWCGRNRKVNYRETKRTFFLDLKFSTDRTGAGSGFSCTVSCDSAPPVSTSPPNPALARPWQGCRCGVPNLMDKIVGGEDTLEHQYPWQVVLTSPRSRRPWCGGSLVSSRTVLTAAHCVQWRRAEEVVVVVGEHEVQLSDGERRHAVCEMTVHPEYSSQDNDHDLALLTLCEAVEWRMEAQPVCLPPSNLDLASVSATVTGYGSLTSGGVQPGRLQAVNVTTMTNRECEEAYGVGVVTAGMICAGDPGRDACQGDSGGPLVTKQRPGSAFTQIGLVSWGVGCAHHQYPGVYTRLSSHMDFITNNMAGDQCEAP